MLETQKLGVGTNAGDPEAWSWHYCWRPRSLELALLLETQKLGVGTNAGDPVAWSWH